MTRILSTIAAFLFCLSTTAQTDGLSLKVVVPQDDLPADAKTQLMSKLTQIVTNYGMADKGLADRFVLTAHVLVSTRDIVPSTPPRISQKLDVVLYLGDVVEDKVYSSLILPVTGVGQNDNKAYINAFQRIPTRSNDLKEWFEESRAKIIAWYENNGRTIMDRADYLVGIGEADAAISSLLSIPDICSVAGAARDKALQIHQEILNREGLAKLQQARNVWAVGQDEAAAVEALALLSEIDITSSASEDAAALASSIGKHMNSRKMKAEEERQHERAKEEEQSQRAWEFEMKKYEDDLELRREQLKSQTSIERAKADAIKTASDKIAGIDFGKVANTLKGWFGK